MDAATPLAVLQRILDEGFSTGNEAIVDELCSPDMVEHQFGLEGTGADAIANLKQAIRFVHTAVPDMTYTIEDSVADGDKVWVRARGRGNATGRLLGPPSGKPIDITVIDVARVVDGRVVEHWGVADRFALLSQTGVLDRLRAGR